MGFKFALAELTVTLAMKEIVFHLAIDDNWGSEIEEAVDGETQGGKVEK